MPAKLTLRVPLMPDELATDYCSRLALRNFRSASQFALDMGFNFSNLARGSETAIAKLAEVSGEPMALLNGNLLRRLSTDRYDLKGQLLTRSTLQLSNFACCPVCLKEDTETCNLPAAAAMRYRMHWMLASVGTCEKHHIVLQKVADRHVGAVRRDWSQIVHSLAQELPVLVSNAIPRAPSSFETYLIDRLYGRTTDNWLDSLECFAADYTTRLFGTVARFGRRAIVDELSESERHAAGEDGFRIVSGGAEPISEFLEELQKNHQRVGKQCSNWELTPRMIFGKLCNSLKRLQGEPAFNAVRKVIADHCLSRFPVGPGDLVLGSTVDKRRVHSVHTLSKQFKLGAPRVVSVLTAGGLLPRPGWNESCTPVDADKAEQLVQRQIESITRRQAIEHLNVSEAVIDKFIEHNFVPRHRRSSGYHGYRFLIPELDALLDALLRDAVPVGPDFDGVMFLSDAAVRVKSSVHEIAQLICDRRLKWVGYRTDLRGVRSIVVDPKDVAEAMAKSRPQKMNTDAVATRLKLSLVAVRYLVKQGLLVGTREKHPIVHLMRLFFNASDVEDFDRTYVSLFNIGRLQGRKPAKLKTELAEKSILPVAHAPGVTTIYRRSDLDL